MLREGRCLEQIGLDTAGGAGVVVQAEGVTHFVTCNRAVGGIPGRGCAVVQFDHDCAVDKYPPDVCQVVWAYQPVCP